MASEKRQLATMKKKTFAPSEAATFGAEQYCEIPPPPTPQTLQAPPPPPPAPIPMPPAPPILVQVGCAVYQFKQAPKPQLPCLLQQQHMAPQQHHQYQQCNSILSQYKMQLCRSEQPADTESTHRLPLGVRVKARGIRSRRAGEDT